MASKARFCMFGNKQKSFGLLENRFMISDGSWKTTLSSCQSLCILRMPRTDYTHSEFGHDMRSWLSNLLNDLNSDSALTCLLGLRMLNCICNTKLNDLSKIVWENLKFLLKKLQFVMSLKIWRSMVYTVCHSPIPITSLTCYSNNYDVILMA